jgi:hypothetical protein
MTQYAYNKSNGTRVIMQSSPEEENVYLIPANSTTVTPPSFKDTEIAVWSDDTDAWVVKDKPDPKLPEGENSNKILPLTDEQVAAVDAMFMLRQKRNTLLAETDVFLIMAIDGPAVPNAVTTYRQALRDLPANNPNPTVARTSDGYNVELNNVTFPTVPQEVLDRR